MGMICFLTRGVVCFVLALLYSGDIFGSAQTYVPSGTAKKCIKVTSIITTFGDGSTEDSCMGCDPARPDCAVGCQDLIDSMYVKCDGVCMPDGYYYDPISTITGCWEEVKPLLKIGVERCGCNAASKSAFTFTVVGCILVILTIFLLVG